MQNVPNALTTAILLCRIVSVVCLKKRLRIFVFAFCNCDTPSKNIPDVSNDSVMFVLLLSLIFSRLYSHECLKMSDLIDVSVLFSV